MTYKKFELSVDHHIGVWLDCLPLNTAGSKELVRKFQSSEIAGRYMHCALEAALHKGPIVDYLLLGVSVSPSKDDFARQIVPYGMHEKLASSPGIRLPAAEDWGVKRLYTGVPNSERASVILDGFNESDLSVLGKSRIIFDCVVFSFGSAGFARQTAASLGRVLERAARAEELDLSLLRSRDV